MTENISRVRVDLTTARIATLVERISDGQVVLPKNCDWWSIGRKSLLIESLLMRVPIGTIAIDVAEWPLAIVDGQNRIAVIRQYMSDDYHTTNLEFFQDASQKKFSQLERYLQRRIEESPLTLAEIEVYGNDKLKQSVIDRLTFGGQA